MPDAFRHGNMRARTTGVNIGAGWLIFTIVHWRERTAASRAVRHIAFSVLNQCSAGVARFGKVPTTSGMVVSGNGNAINYSLRASRSRSARIPYRNFSMS